MTKQDFLTQLQRELNGRIGSKKAADHIEYYQEYIEIELRKGRLLEDVMQELGSPGLIARSIAEVHERTEKKDSERKKRLKYKELFQDLCVGLGLKVFGKLRKWFDDLE